MSMRIGSCSENSAFVQQVADGIPMYINAMRMLLASLLLAITVAGTAFAASGCNGCKIKMIGAGPYYDSLCSTGTCIYVQMEQSVATRPGCSSSTSWHFALDTSTSSGRATYALLLTSYAAGQLVVIGGSGNFLISNSGQVEDLRFVAMYSP